MFEPKDEAAPDQRPALVICAYDADERSWDPVEDLSGRPWSPAGARTLVVEGGEAETLAAVLARHLDDQGCRGLLLVGRTRRSDAFRLQIRAENRSLDRAKTVSLMPVVRSRARRISWSVGR